MPPNARCEGFQGVGYEESGFVVGPQARADGQDGHPPGAVKP